MLSDVLTHALLLVVRRFGFASWWSGTIFMDQLLFLLYNFFFTSLPQIYAAVYDRPVSADILMNVPSLYTRGRLDQGCVGVFDDALCAVAHTPCSLQVQ